ncbi:uncharacterized protein LOC127290747 [Leptopilina boulardi]|uniref:uncharacterized protein LOC127290747 n=1 Tax=Leptopilina boulardi TaxID=63433 RepID=UPI0021F60441|nr:uncharacterized protein LOC127290747 [Leptopilina boulardi]XP_051175489.1 uncharacterized protein LOC127290747 [Leptopilina boulardi]
MQSMISVLGVIAVLSFIITTTAEMGIGSGEHDINHPEQGNRHSSINIANKTINETSRKMSNEIGYESLTIFREFEALEKGTASRANLAERLRDIVNNQNSNLTHEMEIGSINEKSYHQNLGGFLRKSLRKKSNFNSMMKNHSLPESSLESPLESSLEFPSYDPARVASVVSFASDVDEFLREEGGFKPNSLVRTYTEDHVGEENFEDQSHRHSQLTSTGFTVTEKHHVPTEVDSLFLVVDRKSSDEKIASSQLPQLYYVSDPLVQGNKDQGTKNDEQKLFTDEIEHFAKGLDSIEHESTRKNQESKSPNEFLNGKSGSFREIKSSKVINNHRQPNQLILSGKIAQPKISSHLGKYTPYFEDGDEPQNVTARIGNTVVLDCKIGMLSNKTVTWSYHSTDVIRLLTVGRMVYSVDQRISLSFRYPTNWRLKIKYALPRDSGLYECQVATYPQNLVKKVNLLITAPILAIMDDSGRIKSGERHLKAGSALRLRCEARDVLEQHNETVIWTRGDEILTEDVSENRTTEILNEREIQVIISTIVVERATSKHAGNYSCVVPEKAKSTVAVHVLNGELPAAVHDGSGVSRSVLNLWLIHLTVSYVFTR